MGSRLLALLDTDLDNSCEAWNALRAMAADILAVSSMRAATSMQQEVIAVVLHAHGQVELGLSIAVDMKTMLSQLNAMPPEEWTLEYTTLRQELAAVFFELTQDEPLLFRQESSPTNQLLMMLAYGQVVLIP